MEYNIRLEYPLPLTEEAADMLMDAFEAFHPAAGPSDSNNGNTDVWITVDAKNARQAAETGLALSSRVADLSAFEVITTEDFDRREWTTSVPELLGAEDAAAMLGISRQAILKRVENGTLKGHRIGERVTAFARSDIESALTREVVLGFEGGDAHPSGEHWREICDPIYRELRTVGILPAYRAARADENGQDHNPILANQWRRAEGEALAKMATLGYSIDGLKMTATRLDGRAER